MEAFSALFIALSKLKILANEDFELIRLLIPQQSKTSGQWFIQELIPNGLIGAQITFGHWNSTYDAQFPFSINGNQYFYGQNLAPNGIWFIQQLNGVVTS